MKPLITICILVLFLAACKKDKVIPPASSVEMNYVNLKDSAIRFSRIAALDINNDGRHDLLFSTMLVGDPAMQADKKIWFITGSFDCNLAINQNEQTPVLNLNDPIPVNNFNGYNWFNANSAVLARQIIPLNAPAYWEGAFQSAFHKFIPFQVMLADGKYNGWIEVSFSTQESTLKLHKAGISKRANVDVKAGR